MKPLTKDDLVKLCRDCTTYDFTDPESIKQHEIFNRILKDQEMVKRLMESGYVLSKFGKDKTYSQTEMMDVFQAIIEEDEDELTPIELKAVERAEADYKAGRVYTTKELNKKLGLDEEEEK